MARRRKHRLKTLGTEVGGIYRGVFHVYRFWWTEILLLSLIIFVPLGLLDAADSSALDSIHSTHDFRFIALAAGALIITATSMLGEVFLAGAVGLSLSHARDGRPPALRFIARRLNYGRLIAIDLSYVLIVAIGLVLLVIPGIAALVYLSLAGPVAETEDRRYRASFKRSFHLIRGNFWLVFWVIFPIEILGGAIQNGLESALDFLFGESFVVLGLTEALANVALSPLFAIAVVLLTRRLVLFKDGHRLEGPDPQELRAFRSPA